MLLFKSLETGYDMAIKVGQTMRKIRVVEPYM